MENNEFSIQLKTEEFRSVISELLESNQIDEIIETGAYQGDGSTKVFAETGKYVFSIEANYVNWLKSSENLEKYPNVCMIHGLSLKREDLIKQLLDEPFEMIGTNYDSDFPKTFYMREICQQVVVEEALDLFVNNERKQLVFLDSSGGVGHLEFKRLISYGKDVLKNKVVVLDDINHIKHIRSVDFLRRNGFEFGVSTDERFAWCSFQEGKNKDLLILI
jgi:hypothetical protein